MTPEPQTLIATMLKRRAVVDALAEGPTEKRALVDQADVSRSTVDRAIRDLDQAGLVDQVDGGYRLNVAGHLLYEEFVDYAASAATIAAAADLLLYVPVTAPLSLDFLRGADVYTAAEPAPAVPESVLTQTIRGADRIRGLSRSHAAATTDDALRTVVDSGGTIEVVFREAVYDHIREVYDWVADRIASGDVCPYVVDDVPYGLVIADHGEATRCCLVVYDNGILVGLIVNDTDAAVDWTIEVFESYRQQAVPAADLDTE